MVSTKEQPGAFDGMQRAEPDEPVFTLRAHDRLSTELVLEWANRRRELILASDMPDGKRALELIQVRDAEEIAWAMQDWREGRKDDPAETPAQSAPVSYSGHQMTDEEMAAKVRHDALKGAASILHNAVAEIKDVADTLIALGFQNQGASLDDAIAIVRDVAHTVQPKRASYAHKVTE